MNKADKRVLVRVFVFIFVCIREVAAFRVKVGTRVIPAGAEEDVYAR